MKNVANIEKSQRDQHRAENPIAPHIWAVGGGKGGVGKTFVTTSLAVCLARLGYSVTIIDLDLGSANLHTCLGVPTPQATLSDFFCDRVDSLEKLLLPTELARLSYIGGLNDSLNVTNLGAKERQKLMDALPRLRADFVLLDLGAGTHDNTLDFFLMADEKIILVVPEPTSIENAYRFIKAAFYRKLRLTEERLGVKQLVEEAMDQKNRHQIRTPADLIRHVSSVDMIAAHRFADILREFQLNLVVNQARTRPDVDLGHSVKSVCRKYFGFDVRYIGYLDYDNAVWQSLRHRQLLLLHSPHTPLMGQFFNITKHLVDPYSVRAVV